MAKTRRNLLRAGGAALALGLAGCNGSSDSGSTTESDGGTETPGKSSETPAETESGDTETAEETEKETESAGESGPAPAVAAEWNAMRARVDDALAAGAGRDLGAGARISQATFLKFENAGGEWGAHERLEKTSKSDYEGFEEAVTELRSAGLAKGDLQRAREEAGLASDHLGAAQEKLLGAADSNALDLQLLGLGLANAGWLARAGKFSAAATAVRELKGRFEDAAAHDAVESASPESYEAFEGAMEDALSAAKDGDRDGVTTATEEGLSAAIEGSYAVAETEAVAASGHLAVFQARGYDASALSRMGGPSKAFSHAVTLTTYRARVHDAVRLAEAGHADAAAGMVQATFRHFEGARAHEGLEEADHGAYESFESGLESLQSAIGSGSDTKEPLEDVDDALVTGVEKLAGTTAPMLESAYFQARLYDALQVARRGDAATAGSIATELFETFETDEAGFHEALEETNEETYERFEELLSKTKSAGEEGDAQAAADHLGGAIAAVGSYQKSAGSTAQVSAAQSAAMAARAFDARVASTAGDTDRAKSTVQAAFEHFESGAGGFHEALEEANEDLYESFEVALTEVKKAAGSGGVAKATRTFNGKAVDAAYAVVANAGGSFDDAAAAVATSAFERFEGATVHDALEEADEGAYENFEKRLDGLIAAAESGGEVRAKADALARATLRAQFAVAGALGKAPVDESGGGETEEKNLSGGPNVQEGVPEEADHVVKMNAVAYDPKQLTVKKGDTVAFQWAAGEAHSVTAYEEKLPEGAQYWASGGFDSQSAAEEGWKNGKGAVQEGQSYVHTFETAGEHAYYCIPHEKLGMKGTVVVEE